MDESLRQRAKPRLLRVTMPDGEVICYIRAKQTFLETLRRIGPKKFPLIDLKVGIYPLLSTEIYSSYKDYTEEVCDGWNVITVGSASDKYLKLRSIAKQLGLNMKVEIGDDFIPQKAPIKIREIKKDNMLVVVFPDGKYISGMNPVDAFKNAICKIGPDVIRRKEIEYLGKPVITFVKTYNGQIQVGKDMWVVTPMTTKDKYKLLCYLSSTMKLGLKVHIIKSLGMKAQILKKLEG